MYTACSDAPLAGDEGAYVLNYSFGGGSVLPTGLGCMPVELVAVDEFEK